MFMKNKEKQENKENKTQDSGYPWKGQGWGMSLGWDTQWVSEVLEIFYFLSWIHIHFIVFFFTYNKNILLYELNI